MRKRRHARKWESGVQTHMVQLNAGVHSHYIKMPPYVPNRTKRRANFQVTIYKGSVVRERRYHGRYAVWQARGAPVSVGGHQWRPRSAGGSEAMCRGTTHLHTGCPCFFRRALPFVSLVHPHLGEVSEVGWGGNALSAAVRLLSVVYSRARSCLDGGLRTHCTDLRICSKRLPGTRSH